MGDRYYMQQKNAGLDKPGRELKADIVSDINKYLAVELVSLTKMTVNDLKELRKCLMNKLK